MIFSPQWHLTPYPCNFIAKNTPCGHVVEEHGCGMSPVQEIEYALEKLSEEELAEIRAWLWDRDIERDAVAGKLDALADEALQEHRNGQTRRL